MAKIVTYLRDRVTLWAHKTTRETDEDEESDESEEEDYEFTEEGRGLRTERILRAIIHIPVRWFQNVYHAKRLERSLNKEHPECPVRVKVVDKLVGCPLVEKTFDVGLVIIPIMFLISFSLWAISRLCPRYSRWFFETASLVMVVLSILSFVGFGLMFVFAAFFGYEFEYIDGRRYPKRKRNPLESYTKLA